jgi:hypothetical protein
VNDLNFVLRAFDLLSSHRIRTWIFGGWGEELRGLAPPRAHPDVDLLYPARDWSRVDRLDLDWVAAKRLRWKRAFVLDGIRVELFRVDRDGEGWFTELAHRRHEWPEDVFSASGRLSVASAAALAGLQAARAHRLAA